MSVKPLPWTCYSMVVHGQGKIDLGCPKSIFYVMTLVSIILCYNSCNFIVYIQQKSTFFFLLEMHPLTQLFFCILDATCHQHYEETQTQAIRHFCDWSNRHDICIISSSTQMHARRMIYYTTPKALQCLMQE